MDKKRAIEKLNDIRCHVKETSAEEQALVMAINALKAQLSQEDTTSDTISKTETVEHLRRVLEATVPNTDYDEGFIDGVEFGISTVSTMPTIQPVATDTNTGDTISRQRAIDRFNVIRPVDPKKDEYTKGIDVGIAMCIVAVKDQPTAQPEPHEGHWIWVAGELMCSKCRTIYSDLYPDYDNAVACPHCGARMTTSK